MDFKQLKSKRKKLLKLGHELATADLSDLVGKKAKLLKSYVNWIEDHADEIGMSYEEMRVIKTKPTGTIKAARYDREDGFTFTVDFDTFDLRLGINDIEVK